jgi:tubulin polyglutamylase TTLL6/13
LYKLKPYQRISQWPGIQVIAHKNKLGKNLMLMWKEFPEEYDFFPQTYLLPYEMNEFKNQFPLKEDKDLPKHLRKKEKKVS